MEGISFEDIARWLHVGRLILFGGATLLMALITGIVFL
jgi:hypothetical protein